MSRGERREEKLGWTWGWIGGFIWLAVLSAIFLIQKRWVQGAAGLVLLSLALAAIHYLAPWRNPNRPYWQLMIGPYAVFLISAGWAFWAYGGWEKAGLNWWSLLWLVVIFLPLLQAGGRKWKD